MLSETASTSSDGGGLHCGSIELIVEQGARLRYVNLQNWGHEVWHFAHQKAHVGREGRLQWTIGALGARLAKVNQHVAMTGPDAEVQVNGVMFTEGRQHLSYNTHQHHQAPYCKSDLLYKTALQDRSRTVWRGMIKVDHRCAADRRLISGTTISCCRAMRGPIRFRGSKSRPMMCAARTAARAAG